MYPSMVFQRVDNDSSMHQHSHTQTVKHVSGTAIRIYTLTQTVTHVSFRWPKVPSCQEWC